MEQAIQQSFGRKAGVENFVVTDGFKQRHGVGPAFVIAFKPGPAGRWQMLDHNPAGAPLAAPFLAGNRQLAGAKADGGGDLL